MSRFKFVCDCGKRLAAYDWMIGQVINCPKCGRTISVPTPYQAEEHLAEMVEKGYSLQRRQIGRIVDPAERRRTVLLVFALVAGGVVLSLAVYLLFF